MFYTLAKAEFEEAKHPRARDGRFGQTAGSVKKKPAPRLVAEQGKSITPKFKSHQGEVTLREHLNAVETKTLEDYTNYGHIHVNRHLRGLEMVGMKKEAKTTIKHLTSAMKKSSLKEATVLYRGARDGALPNLKAGDKFEDKGFGSTSLKHDTAKNFALRYHEKNDEPKGVVMEIHAPAGTPALYPNHHISDEPPAIFANDPKMAAEYAAQDEREVILPPGCSYRVQKVEKRNGIKHIVVSVEAKHDG